jgi:hypothetical protein
MHEFAILPICCVYPNLACQGMHITPYTSWIHSGYTALPKRFASMCVCLWGV